MNDKSIVVINTPKNCRVCPFINTPWSFCLAEYERENRCPLRPLPQKKPKDNSNELNLGYELGWNACLEEITGETE